MRKLLVHEFISLDGVIQAPGGPDEDRDGGFTAGGWSMAYWHDDIGKNLFAAIAEADAFLLGRKTYVTHAEAFEPMPAGDPVGDMMNRPAKYVVSRTLAKPIWRDTTIIRDDIVASIRALKAKDGGAIVVDGSSQLCHLLFEHDLIDEVYLHVYPLALGKGKRLFPDGCALDRKLKLVSATPYPTGVVGLRYQRA